MTPERVRIRINWNIWLERAGTLALSGVLALIIWLIATTQEDPIQQAQFPEPIPVTLRGLEGTLWPVQDLTERTVRVRLRAPTSSWADLDATDFEAYIDLSGLGVGEHEVAVQVNVVDPRVDILDVQVPELRVELDEVVEKDVTVRVTIMDNPAFGYDAQTPIVEPISVTVSGPATQVDQVTAARAEVFLHNAKSQVERLQSVVPHNTQNQLISQVVVDPALVRIVVPIEQRPGRKEVAVRPNLTGQPAPGYRLSAVRVNPSTVVLLGTNEDLAQVPGFVETAELPLEGATDDVEARLNLILPSAVTVFGGSSVNVVANVTAIEGGTTVKLKPVLRGLSDDLTASVALEAVEVILSGPLPLLDSLVSDDIFVLLELSGLLPGSHVVRPQVVVPDGIQVQGVLPETVEVVVVAPTATPPPTDIPSSVVPTSTVEAASGRETISPVPTPK